MAHCHSSTLEWYCLQQQQEYYRWWLAPIAWLPWRARPATLCTVPWLIGCPRWLGVAANDAIACWLLSTDASLLLRVAGRPRWVLGAATECRHTLTALDWCHATAGGLALHIKIHGNGGSRTSLSLAKFLSRISFEGLLLVYLLKRLSHWTLAISLNSHTELIELLQTCRLPRLVLHSRTCVQGRRQSRLICVSIVLIHLQWNKQRTTN